MTYSTTAKNCFIFFTTFLFLSCQREDHATILVPSDYEGKILVFLERPYGQSPEYEDGKRLYRIPSTGVLYSQFDKKNQSLDIEIFYVDNQGHRKQIENMGTAKYNQDKPINPSQAYIYRGGFENLVLTEGQILKNVSGYKSGDTVKTIGFVLSRPGNWSNIARSSLYQHDSLFEVLQADRTK